MSSAFNVRQYLTTGFYEYFGYTLLSEYFEYHVVKTHLYTVVYQDMLQLLCGKHEIEN